ncbi:receptor expression-enhancing protein 1 isoform X1 [Patella vulgata]|uniref:receptor expression-enhancing protein 1 isoform X1 n=1 Tax=Patella vulgata TaxID=6465 RepID=UPI00217FF37E|nr:receptor expression-enhancing protein 1 isoform X1 [Patella vulgata]
MVSAVISRVVILVFGTLYPAYASYKAVRTKNVKEYVKWMMYWIVFALFLCVETFSDVFISWLPFYYEVKIVFVLWLLSPITKGSSFLFKKFVHPQLAKREKDIDEMIIQASKQGYTTLLRLGSKSITYATSVFMKTALTGHGKLIDHIKRSYSTSDLTDDGSGVTRYIDDDEDEGEDELDNRLIEDNKELELRTEKKVKTTVSRKSEKTKLKKSTSSNTGLSSVMEVDEDDDDVIVTEEVTYIPVTRKHYTHKEPYHYGTLPRYRPSSSEYSLSRYNYNSSWRY